MQQSANWQESAVRLIETQENAAKAAQTAYSQLARVTTCLHLAKTMFFLNLISLLFEMYHSHQKSKILVLVTFIIIPNEMILLFISALQ